MNTQFDLTDEQVTEILNQYFPGEEWDQWPPILHRESLAERAVPELQGFWNMRVLPEVVDALRRCLEWEAHMGGWDASCWQNARDKLKQLGNRVDPLTDIREDE